MKKKICLLVAILFSALSCISQSGIFYKAEFLRAKHNAVTGKITFDDEAFNAVKDLFPGLDKDSVIAELNKNPFIPKMVVKQAGAGASAFNFSASRIGGLDVTRFANAIADIMIERAKQELTIAFFNRFKKFATVDNPEFQILFPKTTDNLTNLLTYNYPQMLPALRNGFFEDLEKITYRLDDVLELPRYRHLLNNFPEITITIRSLRFIQDLENGVSTIADVLKSFAGFEEWKREGSRGFKNTGSIIKLASVFSESLRYKDNTRIWVSGTDVQRLVTDAVYARIYMALILQDVKNQNIKFILGQEDAPVTKDLATILEEQSANILLFQTKVSEFINLADKVQEAHREISAKKAANEKITNPDIYNYINISIEVAEYSFSLVKIFEEGLIADQYFSVIKKANALYRDIYSEQYTQAVNDAVDILNEVHALVEKNTQTIAVARPATALDKTPALERLISFVNKVKPYALFMANMVEAKDEGQVKAALENVILPVGSSSVKKNSQGNISVQTYLGAFLSLSDNNRGEGTWSDKFGVIAPIGVSWTPGALSWEKYGSVSFFTSLFDLGAIVDYKLKKEPDPASTDPNVTVVNKDYKIQLGQIFSPGVYVVYGFFANLPLSLGFGAQYGPGLSKIDAANSPVVRNPSVRWNFFLGVDMPFFTLKNKNRKQ